MNPLAKLRDDINETREELSAHAENVTLSIENAAAAIVGIGAVAILALLLAGYAVVSNGGEKPPW